MIHVWVIQELPLEIVNRFKTHSFSFRGTKGIAKPATRNRSNAACVPTGAFLR
jgi:hypothetical protein